MRQTIFESADVSVVKVPGHREDVVFVTFESFNPNHKPDRAGFGEGFFRSRGFTSYHVLPSANVWYHYPEMKEALARLRADLPAGARVVTYGMSMGGYAAYRFSEWVGADVVIAFSPQYSIDPWRVWWWERRWGSEGKSFIWDRQPPRREAEKYVFYDPLNQDRRHTRRLRREAALETVHAYFSGHATITFVQECGMLEAAVIGIAEDHFDARDFERQLWRQRTASATYHKMRRRKKTGIFRRLRYICIERFLARRLGVAEGSDPAGLLPGQGPV